MNFLFADVPIGKKYKLPFPVLLWFFLALLAVILELSRNSFNNYIIFKYVFVHTLQQQNLYLEYPDSYIDSNHYGPVFSLVIAPFAVLPNWLGAILWAMTNATVLYIAIRMLQFNEKNLLFIFLVGAIELMSSTHQVQFNPMVAGWLILSYVMVERNKTLWATFFIALGFLCKLYGIAGLTFFLFSRDKVKFILYFLMWLVVLFCLPMLISSPSFIVQSHFDWLHSLMAKDSINAHQSVLFGQQDISVIGILRRVLQKESITDIMILAPAAILYGLPLLRFSQYKFEGFRIRYLALALISIVIFSSSAESTTYIIAISGVLFWYVIQEQKSKWLVAMLVLVFFMSILSPTDLMPPPIQHFIRAYALKALPCFMVWLILLYEVGFKKYTTETLAK
ncbi:Protein of unknown function [Filimonas lacunae]|uniref:DUF2029 domain-containing protein n=1 Tax=Filimonas lacunae TaxID=477680 RepID=A0A173MBJ0_9BACT|nr:glycosyltransferase family 87 protein [Filimonas lacunae]BAV04851.1 hypothetical protein FLA_0851 [Filimonas lacunae]SIT34670.1 Protein of unknown function [Filimonas lacunae]